MESCVWVYRRYLFYPPKSEGRINNVDNPLKRSLCLRSRGDRSASVVDNEYRTPRGAIEFCRQSLCQTGIMNRKKIAILPVVAVMLLVVAVSYLGALLVLGRNGPRLKTVEVDSTF